MKTPTSHMLPGLLERPDLRVLELPSPEEAEVDGLFYRTNDHMAWRPTTPAGADNLLFCRSWDDPWVTISRPFNHANDPDGFSTYFQVLGIGSDALLVEGGGSNAEYYWYWTSTWVPAKGTAVTVGPAWYRYQVTESEVQTASDALAQLAPALADAFGEQHAPAGYRWTYRRRTNEPTRKRPADAQ